MNRCFSGFENDETDYVRVRRLVICRRSLPEISVFNFVMTAALMFAVGVVVGAILKG